MANRILEAYFKGTQQQTPALPDALFLHNAENWRPIATAPDTLILVANIQLPVEANGYKLVILWAQAAKRGDGVLRELFYTPTEKAVTGPTHWAYLPPLP